MESTVVDISIYSSLPSNLYYCHCHVYLLYSKTPQQFLFIFLTLSIYLNILLHTHTLLHYYQIYYFFILNFQISFFFYQRLLAFRKCSF